MASAIDASEPADGVPASKAALRDNLQAAKVEIEALQAAQLPAGGLAGQFLSKSSNADNDTVWIDPATAGAGGLGDLADVDLATAPPLDGQTLRFDLGSGRWSPSDPGATAIDDLADVDTSTVAPEPGQALVWDAAVGARRPAEINAGETETVSTALPVANPGAETRNLSGWTAESGSWTVQSSVLAMTAAHGGSFFFYQQSGVDGVLSQTFDLSALGFAPQELDFGATFALSGWAGSAAQSDQGRIEIDWLTADDSLIAVATSGDRGPSNPLGTWEPVDVFGSIPTGTRKGKLRLVTLNRSGSNSTYAFDDLALSLSVRRPATTALAELEDVDLVTAPPVAGDGLRFDGAAWRPTPRAVEVAARVEGRPTSSQVVMRYVAVRSFTLPAALAGSRGAAGTPASVQKSFDLRRNGGTVGTMTFGAGATSTTFTATSATAIAPGDVLTLIAPASRDQALANLAITFLGTA